MTKYSTEATSNDDKTMVPVNNKIIEHSTISSGVYPSTVRGTFNMQLKNNKENRSVINIQDYDIYNVELKDRTILPFQIDNRKKMILSNVAYMPLPIDNGTPTNIANYGLAYPGPQSSMNPLVASVKTPEEALQFCANTCAASNKLKFPQFESNCVGFEFNPNTNSCYGFAPGSVKFNSARKQKKYYMGELNANKNTMSYYSKQFILKESNEPEIPLQRIPLQII